MTGLCFISNYFEKIVDLFVTKKLLTSGSFFSEEFPLNKISIFFVLDVVNE